MAQANDKNAIIYQNLLDAGCDEETTAACMEKVRTGKTAAILPVLMDYRIALRDAVYSGQKQLDALDFLIYQIQRKKCINGGN